MKGSGICDLKPLFDVFDHDRPLNWDDVFTSKGELHVEIGFGMGEVLLRGAAEHPQRNYIGIEQHWQRIYKTLKRITRYNRAAEEHSVQNIKILQIDARVAFARLFAEKSIDRIYSLFPCPWPKKGHIKHRLFSASFLRLLNSRLKDDGQVYIVTDFQPYHLWIQEQLQEQDTGFTCETQVVPPQFNTKFERKWEEEGQDEFYACRFHKKNHIPVPVAKDIELKSFTLEEFDPRSFEGPQQRGEVSVVFKEKVYDPIRGKMMVRLIVSEQHLTQDFWVMIIRKNDKWRVCKADGQKFFPTPGITRAIELVYLAAKQGRPVMESE